MFDLLFGELEDNAIEEANWPISDLKFLCESHLSEKLEISSGEMLLGA